jgi:hypothetical protein
MSEVFDALDATERLLSEDSNTTQSLKTAVAIVGAELLTRILNDADIRTWPAVFYDQEGDTQCYGFEVDSYYDLRIYACPTQCGWFVDLILDSSTIAHARIEKNLVKEVVPHETDRATALAFASAGSGGFLDELNEVIKEHTRRVADAQRLLARLN